MLSVNYDRIAIPVEFRGRLGRLLLLLPDGFTSIDGADLVAVIGDYSVGHDRFDTANDPRIVGGEIVGFAEVIREIVELQPIARLATADALPIPEPDGLGVLLAAAVSVIPVEVVSFGGQFFACQCFGDVESVDLVVLGAG